MKQQEKVYIGFRESVLIIGLTLIIAIVQMMCAIPFSAAPFMLAYVSIPVSMILSGAIFVLIMNKAPYRGTMFLFVFILSAPMIFMGVNYIPPVTIFIIGGAIGELIFWKDRTRTVKKLCMAYAIYAISYGIGTYGSTLLTKETLIAQLVEQNAPQELINAYNSLYTLPAIGGSVLLGMISAVIGILIGSKIFKKHFARITA